MWEASNEALLAGFATGDPDAAAAFIRRFQRRVYGLARSIVGDASIATTRMRAPVSISAPIFGSPTLPAPTTRDRRPASFTNMGNRLVTVSSCRVCEVAGRAG